MEKLSILIILFKAHNNLQKQVKKSLAGTDLSVNEFTVMEALYSKGKLNPGQISTAILIPNSSLTYVLDKLEEKNYIQREYSDLDKRSNDIYLTELGKSIFEEIYQKHVSHMKPIFNVLSKDEQQTLETLLKKVGKQAN